MWANVVSAQAMRAMVEYGSSLDRKEERQRACRVTKGYTSKRPWEIMREIGTEEAGEGETFGQDEEIEEAPESDQGK